MKTIKYVGMAIAIFSAFSVQAEAQKYSSPSLCAEVRDLAEVMMLSHQAGIEMGRVYNDIKDLHGAPAILIDAYASVKVDRADIATRESVSKQFADKWYFTCMNEGI